MTLSLQKQMIFNYWRASSCLNPQVFSAAKKQINLQPQEGREMDFSWDLHLETCWITFLSSQNLGLLGHWGVSLQQIIFDQFWVGQPRSAMNCIMLMNFCDVDYIYNGCCCNGNFCFELLIEHLQVCHTMIQMWN